MIFFEKLYKQIGFRIIVEELLLKVAQIFILADCKDRQSSQADGLFALPFRLTLIAFVHPITDLKKIALGKIAAKPTFQNR